jgi:hypothetical protein
MINHFSRRLLGGRMQRGGGGGISCDPNLVVFDFFGRGLLLVSFLVFPGHTGSVFFVRVSQKVSFTK